MTEQFETQDALQRSEEHIRALVHHSADLLAVIDTDGILLDPMSNQILGYPAGALLGLNTLELVHHDDLESALATLAQSRAQPEQPVRAELRVRHADARWRRFDMVMTNHLDDPVVCGIIVNGHDVTERVDAERELIASEAEFRFLAERASDMIYRFRTTGDLGYEYVSPACEELTGFTPAEYYADPELMLNRLHPDDRHVAIGHLAHPDSVSDEMRRMRMRMLHKNGTWIWTEHQMVPVLDEHGDMIAAEGIARDITEQVRAADEILERELFSRSVLESIQGPATVVDADGTILAVNADWIAGRSGHDDDLGSGNVGTNYLALCDDEASRGVPGSAQAAAGLRAVLSGAEEGFRLDYPIYGPDEERWFMLRVSPLRTATGGAIVHHLDITDRKVYEQQLARQAIRDPLTGLANRALLADRLEGALARAASTGVDGCLAGARPRPLQHRQRRPRPRRG